MLPRYFIGCLTAVGFGAIALGLVVAKQGRADTAPPLPPLAAAKACELRAGTERDAVMCFETAFIEWDYRLNQTYSRLMAEARQINDRERLAYDGTAENLLEMQRAWIVFRDSLCRMERYGFERSSHIAETECLLRETIRQQQILDGFASS